VYFLGLDPAQSIKANTLYSASIAHQRSSGTTSLSSSFTSAAGAAAQSSADLKGSQLLLLLLFSVDFSCQK
jgi:hypothetical protein